MKYIPEKPFFNGLRIYSVEAIVSPKPSLAFTFPANVCEFYSSIYLSFIHTSVNIFMNKKGDYHKENALKYV